MHEVTCDACFVYVIYWSRGRIQRARSLCRRDPNGAVPNASASEAKNQQQPKGHDDTPTEYWDTYDTINQFYLELGKFFLFKLSHLKFRPFRRGGAEKIGGS